MTLTIEFGWWVIPTAITIIGVIWAVAYDDGGGYLSGIGNIFALCFALAVSGIAWMIAGFFK